MVRASERARFLMSTENECLTVAQGKRYTSPDGLFVITRAFLDELSRVAPTLPGTSGIFNGYGRVYIDTGGHLEFAAAECDSPYLLPTIVEQQQQLACRAIDELTHHGETPERGLLLANNNYSGLFTSSAPTWGAHSNYLVEEHPRSFGKRILPFLVTRLYAGAGVVESPSGRFLASARAHLMDTDYGGGTTQCRAIHSTSRDEGHMGDGDGWRYHLICGDGHRSHFNLALQFGATALALKAIFHDPQLPQRLRKIKGASSRAPWLHAMRSLNILARPDGALQVHPVVVEIQRVYLEGAWAYATSLTHPPAWVQRLLHDWEATLDAMEHGDHDWLAARLDAWAKYKLFTLVLNQRGYGWEDLARAPQLFNELALLDQQYHCFTDPSSPFTRLEQAGALKHRVARALPPGGELEPFVPATNTRAAARARLIRQEADRKNPLDSPLKLDWSCVVDTQRKRQRLLLHPFDQHFTKWSRSVEVANWSSDLLSWLLESIGCRHTTED